MLRSNFILGLLFLIISCKDVEENESALPCFQIGAHEYFNLSNSLEGKLVLDSNIKIIVSDTVRDPYFVEVLLDPDLVKDYNTDNYRFDEIMKRIRESKNKYNQTIYCNKVIDTLTFKDFKETKQENVVFIYRNRSIEV